VLSRAIATQRAERGRLNRFLVRRVRGELSGTPSGPGRGFRRLAELSDSLARASVRRAALAGTMEAFAALGGLVAMLMILWPVFGGASGPGLAGNLMLTGFMAARLLESARALHARIGGGIALDRLEERLSAAAAPRAGRNRRRSPVARSAALRAGLPRPTQSLLSLTPPSASSSENTP
jgi:hypothetical protein